MEINFIPIENYTSLYIQLLMVVVLFIFIHSLVYKIGDKKNLLILRITGFFLVPFIILYMGLRPIDDTFGDMVRYASRYEAYSKGLPILSFKDVFFQIFMKFCASIMSVSSFFLLATILYVAPLYIVVKKWFKAYWIYAFIMLIGSLSFWGYGVNGIRNGIASSFFLLAISRSNLASKWFLFLVAIAFHKSLLLPTVAYIITFVYNKPREYLLIWCITIPISLFAGSFFEVFFASFIEDDRASYLAGEESILVRNSFRWDFILYSATGVFAGWYYVFKKKFSDKLYIRILNVYLFCNTFWILVIRANFTNRFSYLSWFLLAIVIIYPLLKVRILNKQEFKIGLISFLYVGFTYVMLVFL